MLGKKAAPLAWQRLKTSILETKPQDVVRLVIIFACLLLVYDQIQKCLQKLKNPPISTRNELRFNSSMSYPSLTICREPPYKRVLYRQFNMTDIHLGSAPLTSQWIRYPYDKYSIKDFFDATTYKRQDIFVTSTLDASRENTKLTTTLTYTLGLCHTIQPLIETSSTGKKVGYNLVLNHDLYQYVAVLDNDPGWHIYLHESEETFSENTELASSRQDYVFLPVGEELDISVDAIQFNLLRNCSTEGNYSVTKCEESCWLNEIQNKINCGVPWLPTINLTLCSNYVELLKVLQATFAMSYKNCCVPKCRTTRYRANIVRRSDFGKTALISSLSVFFSTKAIQTIEETYGYDWNLFVADLGGSVGFLLGLSVIGIIGILETIVEFICGGKKKKQQKKEKQKESLKAITYPDQSWKFDSPLSGSARSSAKLIAAFERY